ncbi:E3 ubiquitin-protein ligase XIAP-like [Ruditapes philippinarum]|uniref:E3 ubiquitin-protein ligase XIAP-like n=1 Tax=Ruditapes philippinarum TaxID=129788 RepID=UPI00295B452A|nr:E3 ubiquitin-protein ligase XIAP-like [Ruditapes philippinarum]
MNNNQRRPSTQRFKKKHRSKCINLGITFFKPKHRQYCTLDSRIKSYENENWIKDNTPGIKELAEAGLTYRGVADSVSCYYCNIGLQNWAKDACPWEQHVLASPDCAHVAQCKGKAYIRKILGENDQDSNVEVDDSKEFVDTVEEAFKRNEAAVTAAKQYYTNKQIINKAVKSLIKGYRQRSFTAVELIAAIEEVEKEQLGNNSQAKSEDVETDGSTSETDEEDEEELNRQLKEPITCKICFNAIACIVTLPCGHMFSCPQCLPALTKCAVCRSDINGTVRAKMAV